MRREVDEMKLTAFALDELEGRERDAIAERLADDAAGRQFVEEVRSTARLLGEQFGNEPPVGLDAIHYAAIELRLRQRPSPARLADRRMVLRNRASLALTIAASIVIVCAAIGAVLCGLYRQPDVAAKPAQTRPADHPLIVQVDPNSVTREYAGAGGASSAEPFVPVSRQPVSLVPLGTEADSYNDVRRALFDDRLPAPDSVRIESLVNAYTYDYPAPVGGAVFGAAVEVGRCPWNGSHRLARVAIKARSGGEIVAEQARAEIAFRSEAITSYRLIGYEGNSGPADAGEPVAGGHAVTVLYEVVPTAAGKPSDLLTLRIRYRDPGSAKEQVSQFAGRDGGTGDGSADLRFAASVAEFGMLLRHSPARGDASFDSVIQLADAARGADRDGQRNQFIALVRRARDIIG